MENIIWYKFNENGFIIGDNEFLVQAPGIYVYRFKLDISKIYIGSAVNIAQRFRQHRCRCSIYKVNNSKFYNLVKNMVEIILNMVYLKNYLVKILILIRVYY